MPKTLDVRRHWRLRDAWPNRDRLAWERGIVPPHALDIPTYGQSLTRASVSSIERAYGRFLNWLELEGLLDREAAAETRPTAGRVGDYLRHLDALEYSSATRILLLSGLRSAMRIMAPDDQWLWIVRPGGAPIMSTFYICEPRRKVIVPKTSELYQWGLGLCDSAQQVARGDRRLAQFRDGVIIALLAARPVRVRTLASLELGRHLTRTDAAWRLRLEPSDMKNRRALELDLPKTLIPWLDSYLSDVRPRLLGSEPSYAVWIAAKGGAIPQTEIGQMVLRRSLRRFGVAFGPHRFRHAAATSATEELPESPGIAASMLAVGANMIRKHYDRTDEVFAARRYHDALSVERHKLEDIARKIFVQNSSSA